MANKNHDKSSTEDVPRRTSQKGFVGDLVNRKLCLRRGQDRRDLLDYQESLTEGSIFKRMPENLETFARSDSRESLRGYGRKNNEQSDFSLDGLDSKRIVSGSAL